MHDVAEDRADQHVGCRGQFSVWHGPGQQGEAGADDGFGGVDECFGLGGEQGQQVVACAMGGARDGVEQRAFCGADEHVAAGGADRGRQVGGVGLERCVAVWVAAIGVILATWSGVFPLGEREGFGPVSSGCDAAAELHDVTGAVDRECPGQPVTAAIEGK